jgi:hypothetical protein
VRHFSRTFLGSRLWFCVSFSLFLFAFIVKVTLLLWFNHVVVYHYLVLMQFFLISISVLDFAVYPQSPCLHCHRTIQKCFSFKGIGAIKLWFEPIISILVRSLVLHSLFNCVHLLNCQLSCLICYTQGMPSYPKGIRVPCFVLVLYLYITS